MLNVLYFLSREGKALWSITLGSLGSCSLSAYLVMLCKNIMYLMVRSNKESMLHCFISTAFVNILRFWINLMQNTRLVVMMRRIYLSTIGNDPSQLSNAVLNLLTIFGSRSSCFTWPSSFPRDLIVLHHLLRPSYSFLWLWQYFFLLITFKYCLMLPKKLSSEQCMAVIEVLCSVWHVNGTSSIPIRPKDGELNPSDSSHEVTVP